MNYSTTDKYHKYLPHTNTTLKYTHNSYYNSPGEQVNWDLLHLCLVASCSGLTTGFSGTTRPHSNSSELSPQSLIPSHRHQYGRQFPLLHLNIQSKQDPLWGNTGGSVLGLGINFVWPTEEQFFSSNESTSLQSFSPSQT